jgi:hypothetical protein
MVIPETRNKDKQKDDYATNHIVLKEKTMSMIKHIMPGKRYTDDIVRLALSELCAKLCGNDGCIYFPDAIRDGMEFKLRIDRFRTNIRVIKDTDAYTGRARLFFSLTDIGEILKMKDRLYKYVDEPRPVIAERYKKEVLHGNREIFVSSTGVFLTFQQVRRNTPVNERKDICDDMFAIQCFCESVVIADPDDDKINAVVVFEPDW